MLSVSRNYNIKFICNYKLLWYPFDTQICSMNFSLLKEDDAYLLEMMKPESIPNNIPGEVSQYYMKTVTVAYANMTNSTTKGIVVSFTMGRMIISQLMTVYIPTALIMIVSYLTTFFNNSKWFGHIITINLTAMLVLTTMLTSISDDLPKTADVKYIDFWMLFSLCVPVFEILLHTVEDHLIRKANDEEDEDSRPATGMARSNSDTWLAVNAKMIKVLPVEDHLLSLEQVKETRHKSRKSHTKWLLLYIEFIGHVLILVFMVLFTSIYWCIGLLVQYDIY